MTFESREASVHDGAPLECYRFVQGEESWLLTSADDPVTLPSGTYQPEAISRGELDHSQESLSGALEITLPGTHALVAPYIPYAPPRPTAVTLYRAHRGEESDARVRFVGRVGSVRFDGAAAVLRCLPLDAAFQRSLPILTFQSLCQWALYGPGCGINATAYRELATVTAVSGSTVTALAFAGHADGWWTNGWIEGPGGEVRFVVAHAGQVVTVAEPIPGLAPGQVVAAYAGCDRTEATCAGKFTNLANHMGWARIPTRNPHRGNLI